MKNSALFLLFLFFANVPAHAQVRLPKLVSDGMVLQRDEPVTIWGWAAPGEKVGVSFMKKTYKATTGKDSIWKVQLQAQKAGGPYTMEIKGSNTIELNDIVFGDVWLCAGQSNMVHQMRLHNIIYAEEVATANYPEIRQFLVPNTVNLQGPQSQLQESSWKSAIPENIGEFSAVAYFFAKKLHEKYKIPIGIINASWGGTPVEAWTSEEGFKDFSSIQETVNKNKDTAYINLLKSNSAKAVRKPIADEGLDNKWFDVNYDPKGWRTIAIPGYWEDQGVRNLDGVVWYRREIEVPEGMTRQHAKVFLGRIVDADELYINGQKVGSTGYMYPQRRYTVPAGVLKPGKNLFVVRVTNNGGKGGFVPDKPYYLATARDTVNLTGYWQYKVGGVQTPFKPEYSSVNLHNQPTALYNSMIAPLTNYKIKGIAWYQGESNASRADEYAALQTALINDWRSKWQSPSLPFLFVQLPGFMDYDYLPSESQWALFREAQSQTLAVPNTAMAVAIDLGEWNDIHPDRKKEVGERLALAALKTAYKEKLVSSGPTFTSIREANGRLEVTFDNIGSGLTTSDGEAPSEFAIAGADGKFVWAKAKIEGNKVILWNDDIEKPLHGRYAWADNPVNPNLINKEGLPAAPFRTDK